MPPRRLGDLTEREATRCLDIYVREAPRRIQALLERACAERAQIRPAQLDRTAESLVPLWEWLVQHAGMKLSAEFPPPDPLWLIVAEGAAIDSDLAEWSDRLGLYVATCFKTTFPERGIRWKLCDDPAPELHFQPVLAGFRRPFCPRLLIYDLASRIPHGLTAGRALADAFEMWTEDLGVGKR